MVLILFVIKTNLLCVNIDDKKISFRRQISICFNLRASKIEKGEDSLPPISNCFNIAERLKPL